MRKYFKRIKDILTYYDYQPMLFFLAVYDILSQLNVWMHNPGMGDEESNYTKYFDLFYFGGGILTEWIYLVYTLLSVFIILFLHKENVLVKLLIPKVIIGLLFIIDDFIYFGKTIFGLVELSFTEYYSLVMIGELWWPIVWGWVLFQMMKKRLYLNANK